MSDLRQVFSGYIRLIQVCRLSEVMPGLVRLGQVKQVMAG